MSDQQEMKRPELGREIATTGDGIDITRGYTGPLLLPFDSVLRNRGNFDLQIYEQVLSDEEVKATLGQRHSAVTSCEWQVDAGGDRRVDKQAAEWLRRQLNRIGWDNITAKMLFGEFYGYAVAELIYGVDEGKICIDAIKVRNRRRFRYGKDGDLRMLTPSAMYEGVPCERPYFWDFCCGADHDDEPYGLGLAHWLYWPVLFKRNGIKFWLVFLEKFGMPTGVGRYDADSTNDAERRMLLQATRAMQTDSGIIMPKGMELELLEAGRSGTADYKGLFDTMNASIQKVVLGQTASTQGTPGRLGNDDLQGDVQAAIVKAAADLVDESFNKGPVRRLMEWNFPTAELPRVYRVTEEPEDIDALAERYGKIYNIGFKPSLADIQEKFGGEWVEKQPPALPGTAQTPSAISGPEFANAERTVINLVRDMIRRHPATFAQGDGADPPALMAAQLDRRLAPAGRQWIDQVRELAQRADSLEELRDGLLALDLDLDEYADAMAEALTASHLAGRYEVLQELQG